MKDVVVQVVCIMLAGALLVAAGMQLDYVNAKREEMNLVMNDPLENAPPSLAFATAAMGAFRGLVVDILWIRADNLKEKGQFFDAKQLADWITKLQPRFASVWEFHAWNMAYNISVAIPASQPDQRWKWVRNGYELLRDKGIPLNPKAIGLYRELARIFQHKIGDVADDCHKYYKLQLATQMEPLLGPADNEYFDALAAAPEDWKSLLSDPNLAAMDPNVGDIVSALEAADERFTERDRFVINYLSLRRNASRFDAAAGEAIDNFRGTKALEKFDVFAKAYQLRNVWRLDPVIMRELNQTYGPTDFSDPNNKLPLDWRHPDCHAIYWGVMGVRRQAQNEDRDYGITEINTDRIVGHSLQNLYRNGKISLYEDTVEIPVGATGETRTERRLHIFLRPDFRMFESYHQAYLAIFEKYKEANPGSEKSLHDGHRNLLRDAVFAFYQAGHKKQAQRIYSTLREMYPRDEFKVSLDQYARNRLKEEFDTGAITPNDAKQQIIMTLSEGYFRYALRDDEAAYAREQFARQIWQHYQKQYPEEQRIDLPDLDRLKYEALAHFLEDERYPVSLRRGLLARIKVERPDLHKTLSTQEEKILEQYRKQQENKQPQS